MNLQGGKKVSSSFDASSWRKGEREKKKMDEPVGDGKVELRYGADSSSMTSPRHVL